MFRWNPASERYIAPSGRFVSRAAVRASLDHTLDRQMARVRTLSERLVSGQADLADWRQGMAQSLKIAHLEGAAVARGGWAQLSASDLAWTQQRIRNQLWYLQRFHDDLAGGVVPLNAPSIASRAEMYIENARGTQREMERRMAVSRGRQLEKNVLGGSKDPCSQCPALSVLGYVPINTLPPVGSRQCLSRCHCWLLFKNQPVP